MRAHNEIEWYACDFETTVYAGQEFTEVWSSAFVRGKTEDVIIHTRIEDTFKYFVKLKRNVTLYYHNLKFDGTFWIDYLLRKTKYKQALTADGNSFLPDYQMPSSSFKYLISANGMWYTVTIRTPYAYIYIKDSYKLLPFSLEAIGKAFGTKHKKLKMEYAGFRQAGDTIPEEDKPYIKNDVLVLKEALEIMFEDGYKKLTIGSCCMEEFKKEYPKQYFDTLFPQVYDMDLPFQIPHINNVGEYIVKSYYGGYCYAVDGKRNRWFYNGITDDAYSLYPSVMHSKSCNRYPVGSPTFWIGDIPDEIMHNEKYYFFVRIRTRFKLKSGYLPFIQIKHNLLYKGTEMLKTSDVLIDGEYRDSYVYNDTVHEAKPTLVLTCIDYYRILDFYDLIDCEYLDGCFFETAIGLFDEYIDRFNKIKMTATGARRTESKLFLNNLYGKFATKTDSSFKVITLENGIMHYHTIFENEKKAGYIPIGSAVTSYARDKTIRIAQANYHGDSEKGFIYADTDSVHADITTEETINIPHAKNGLCTWKTESKWEKAIFIRSKTYLEIVDGFPDIKCAGMPKRCKNLFLASCGYKKAMISLLLQNEDFNESELQEIEKLEIQEMIPYGKFTDEEKEYLSVKRTLEDFKIGMKVPSKLRPKLIRGGTVLESTYFTMLR